MRGGYLHNHVLLDPIEMHFSALGARQRREHPTARGRSAGFVDLFIEHRPWRIACEAELSSRRIENDLAKAASLHASLLMIVVPTKRVARAVQRKLQNIESPQLELPIWVLPLGPMLRRIALCFPLNSTSIVDGKREKKCPSGKEIDS